MLSGEEKKKCRKWRRGEVKEIEESREDGGRWR
jgi:hypothetical protein